MRFNWRLYSPCVHNYIHYMHARYVNRSTDCLAVLLLLKLCATACLKFFSAHSSVSVTVHSLATSSGTTILLIRMRNRAKSKICASMNNIWDRKEVAYCTCAARQAPHAHCPCEDCKGNAVSRSTELRHWKNSLQVAGTRVALIKTICDYMCCFNL